VISLVGLTLLPLSFMPELKAQSWGLFTHATAMLLVHSAYSFYEFYKLSLVLMYVKNVKRVAIYFGSACQVSQGRRRVTVVRVDHRVLSAELRVGYSGGMTNESLCRRGRWCLWRTTSSWRPSGWRSWARWSSAPCTSSSWSGRPGSSR
jgi:hypothetical protein